MNERVTVFISHVSEDETIALALKDFLEGIFLNASVFVSGRDLTGGQVWIEELRSQLANATAILALVSQRSLGSEWVYFEAGAGFCRQCTIPLLISGVTVEDVGPPFSLLQLRRIDQVGLQTMVRDIAGLAQMRTPARFPGLDQALAEIGNFLKLRAESEPPSEDLAEDFDETRDGWGELLPREPDPDPELQSSTQEIQNRRRQLTIRAIRSQEAPFDVPTDDELRKMSLNEIQSIARAVGVHEPLELMGIGPPIPGVNAPVWEKINEKNRIARARTALDQWEASLLARRLTSR
jgi:hypothetical protein